MIRALVQNFTTKNVGEDVYIEGYANKRVVDDVGDMMLFDKVDLVRFKKNPILLWNHDRDFPVGKVVDIKVTPDGLWVKAKISNSTNKVVSYVRDLVKEGILKTFSIGFDPKKERRESGYNEISEWRLNEISVVTLPANIEAEFALAKSLAGAKDYTEARNMVIKAISESEGGEPSASGGDTPSEGSESGESFRECLASKIPALVADGRSQAEAVAVAMSMCRDEGKCSIDVLTKEMFEIANQIAAGCAPKKPDEEEKPKEPEEKQIVPPAVPVQAEDPTAFGNPAMDLMKSQLSLLGKISEQLGAIHSTLAKTTQVEENETQTVGNAGAQEASKQKEEIEKIQLRINSIIKDLGI